jgi:hypothetical protein
MGPVAAGPVLVFREMLAVLLRFAVNIMRTS